ncbi:MAG: hypothetical protein IKN43_07605 [Selenomonadaceae bacterium]|nr:hypothetical protein [Selenomonadaceae bacterium]
MEKEKFIQIGNDRLCLSNIKAYGIKTWNRYFVRNETNSEVDRFTYNSAFNMYSEVENLYANNDPMVDINGYPIYMNGEVMREGQLPPNAFDIEVSRVLYVYALPERRAFLYVAGRVDFDIDEIVAKLDRLFLEEKF